MAYCVPSDLYSYGLPRGGTPNPGRLVGGVDTSADTLELDVHGFADGDSVRFRAEAGGALPAPLVEGVEYFALAISESTFSVEDSIGSGAIDLTTEGARIVVHTPLPIPAAIEWASRIIDDMLPAHAVPMPDPVHELIRATCAELAAGKILALKGAGSRTLGEMIQYAQKRLERWSKGVPLRGDNTPQASNLAQSEAASSSDGWSTYGGL